MKNTIEEKIKKNLGKIILIIWIIDLVIVVTDILLKGSITLYYGIYTVIAFLISLVLVYNFGEEEDDGIWGPGMY